MNKSKFYALLIVLMISNCFSWAQEADSLNKKTKKIQKWEEFENKKWKFIFMLDGRRSIVRDEQVNVFGLKIGMQRYRKYRFGLGLYDLSSEVNAETTLLINNLEKEVPVLFKFTYLSAFYDKIFYRDWRWELTGTVQLGLGSSRFEYSTDEELIELDERTISVFEPSVSGHYKIFNWLGIGAGVGYRWILRNNEAIDINISSPIYLYKIKLFLAYLYKPLFKKKQRKND